MWNMPGSSEVGFERNILYALLVVFLFFSAYLWKKNQKLRRFPPGPWQLPILGYLPWIDAEKPHETLTKLTRTYGPICGLGMGSVYTVLLSDPQLIKQAFSKDAVAGRAPLYLTHGIMQGYGKVGTYVCSFHLTSRRDEFRTIKLLIPSYSSSTSKHQLFRKFSFRAFFFCFSQRDKFSIHMRRDSKAR